MTDVSNNAVFAVVLAAGTASRFGSTKQLARAGGVALVKRAADTAIATCGSRTAIVLGHDGQRVAAACLPFDGFLLVNDDYAKGLGTSIAHATRALRHTAGALLFVLADQALVAKEHLDAIVTTWSGDADEIVATAFEGTIGPPVLFPRACFADLAVLDGEFGARKLLRDTRFRVTTVACDDAAVDIDTPEDLSRL